MSYSFPSYHALINTSISILRAETYIIPVAPNAALRTHLPQQEVRAIHSTIVWLMLLQSAVISMFFPPLTSQRGQHACHLPRQRIQKCTSTACEVRKTTALRGQQVKPLHMPRTTQNNSGRTASSPILGGKPPSVDLHLQVDPGGADLDAVHHDFQETVVVGLQIVDFKHRLGVVRAAEGRTPRVLASSSVVADRVVQDAYHLVGGGRDAHEIKVHAQLVLCERAGRRRTRDSDITRDRRVSRVGRGRQPRRQHQQQQQQRRQVSKNIASIHGSFFATRLTLGTAKIGASVSNIDVLCERGVFLTHGEKGRDKLTTPEVLFDEAGAVTSYSTEFVAA